MLNSEQNAEECDVRDGDSPKGPKDSLGGCLWHSTTAGHQIKTTNRKIYKIVNNLCF